MQGHMKTSSIIKVTALTKPAASLLCAPSRPQHNSNSSRASVVAAVFGGGKKGDTDKPHISDDITGIVFQPFQEVGGQLNILDDIMDNRVAPGPTTMTTESLARFRYADELEAAVNEQIKKALKLSVEYTMSYIYHALSAFMDRDNVGLPGFAAYFKHQSDEEREHANKLMVQQNRRGGRVKLQTIMRPESEFSNADQGEALWSLELALGLEKINFGKLRELHTVAGRADDAEMCQFIEDNLLREQAQDVKFAADLVSRAKRAGPGLGVFEVDMYLQREYGYGLASEGGNGAA